LKIRLYYIGKSSKHIYKEAEDLFVKRIKHYCPIELIKLTPLKLSKSLSADEIKTKEAAYFLSKIKSGRLILLDETGKRFNSKNFAQELQKELGAFSNINFLIGGAYGFSDSIKKKADKLLALSELTFPHHLARVLLLEQIYRAFSILNNEPYHNQ